MDRDYVGERYRTRDGKVPFEEWVARMNRRDPDTVFRILMRIKLAIDYWKDHQIKGQSNERH